MNRLGWLLLAIFALVGIGFALVVRTGEAGKQVAVPLPGREAAAGPAGLSIPVVGVPANKLVGTFGQARAEGARQHQALDIPAPRGTIVMAAAPGRIEKLFESKDGGRTIYVRSHDGRWIHYYAHLDSILPTIAEGVRIERAQAIGTVGSTGNADPATPHLRVEVKRMAPGETWYQGQPIDPLPLLAAR